MTTVADRHVYVNKHNAFDDECFYAFGFKAASHFYSDQWQIWRPGIHIRAAKSFLKSPPDASNVGQRH